MGGYRSSHSRLVRGVPPVRQGRDQSGWWPGHLRPFLAPATRQNRTGKSMKALCCQLFRTRVRLPPPPPLQNSMLISEGQWRDALPFLDHVELIDLSWRWDLLHLATRPAHLNLVDFLRATQTEVGPLIQARRKAASGQHILPLRKSVRRHED